MNGKRMLVLLCALVLCLAAMPAGAQEDSTAIAREMAGINRSLERMTSLLETLIGNQQIDIVLKRIELMERRLEPLESELRRSERAVIDLDARVKRMNEQREEVEDAIADDIRTGVDQPDSENRRMKAQLDSVIESESGRVEEMRRRARQLEDDLADGREEIKILDDQLKDLLQ